MGGVLPTMLFRVVVFEQIRVTQYNLLTSPGAMLSAVLVLVGGRRLLCRKTTHLVSWHTSDFLGDFSKPHGMSKAYSEIWEAKFSHAFTHTFVLVFHLVHVLILQSQKLLLFAASSVFQQRNCHF